MIIYYGLIILVQILISSALGWNAGSITHMTTNVRSQPTTIHPTTSINVCHNISLRNWKFWPILRRSCISSLISLRYLACIPAWYLTFIASYQNRNDTPNVSANSGHPRHVLIPITTQILLEIPLWTDGNPPALHNESRRMLFSTLKSITILKIWIILPTMRGIRNNGIDIRIEYIYFIRLVLPLFLGIRNSGRLIGNRDICWSCVFSCIRCRGSLHIGNYFFDFFFHDWINSFEHIDELACLGISFFEVIIISVEFSYDTTKIIVFYEKFSYFFFENKILFSEFFGFSWET